MTQNGRDTRWRQGDILTPECLSALGLVADDNTLGIYAVVISHDCDLAASVKIESTCEVILGKRIDKVGAASHSKMSRRLDIEYDCDGEPFSIELDARKKSEISKAELRRYDPHTGLRLNGRGIGILRSWLASRYKREGFPENFGEYFGSKAAIPVKELEKKIEKILDSANRHIKMLLFDLDHGLFQEREPDADPYQLGIYVIYESEPDARLALSEAKRVAEELDVLLDSAFKQEDGSWKGVQILFTDVMSDNSLTLYQRERFSEWKLDYLSFENEPTD